AAWPRTVRCRRAPQSPLDELASENESRCTARFSPDSRARPGDHIQVNIATEKMHFFDNATHLAIRY
ncbi:MAG: hypothetical protein P8P85_04970, partial [Acidimicrobiales bacterium]|nr:hypothetical protein [Acidimicrobiales bacterium]